MKLLSISLLVFAVAAAPARDNGGVKGYNRLLNDVMFRRFANTAGSKVPEQTFTDGKNMQLNRFLNDTIYKKIRYGPFKLPSKDQKTLATLVTGEKGSISEFADIEPFCTDCFILQSKTYLEYANGTEASAATGVYNHHAIYTYPKGNSQMIVCSGLGSGFNRGPKLMGGAAIDGSYSLYTSPDGKFKSGNYIAKDGQIKLVAELINYNTEPQEVYVTTDIEAVPGPRSDYMNAVTLPFSAVPCVEAQFVLKAPVSARTSVPYVVPENAVILNVGGHMHDGGDKVSLSVNNKEICGSKAVYDAKSVTTGASHGGGMAQSMSGMTKCNDIVEVKKGDKLTVSALFNATAHPMRVNNNGKAETVMGLSAVTFAYPQGTTFMF